MNDYALEGYQDEWDEYPDAAEPASHRIWATDPRFLFFLLFFGTKALMPGTKDLWYWVAGVQVRQSEILLLMMGVIFIIARLFFFSREFPCRRATKRFFFYPLFLLGLCQIISLIWGEINLKTQALFYALYMLSALIGAVFAVSGLPEERRRLFMDKSTFFLAFVLLVYIGLSFFFSSLRAGQQYFESNEDLGWIRVCGPLAGAATIGFLVLPAIGYCLGMFYTSSGQARKGWLSLTIFFIVAGVLSGSRAGMLGIGFLFVLWSLPFVKKAIKFLIPISILIGIVVLVWGIPERFKELGDNDRFNSYKTGMRAFSSSPLSILVGHGHNSFYGTSVYVRKKFSESRLGVYSRQTQYGWSLENSHSTYVRTLVESGILGFLCVVTPLIWLVYRCFDGRYRKIKSPLMIQARMTLLGCIATAPLMAMDDYIIKNYWIFLVWAIYAVSAAETVVEAEYLESDVYEETVVSSQESGVS